MRIQPLAPKTRHNVDEGYTKRRKPPHASNRRSQALVDPGGLDGNDTTTLSPPLSSGAVVKVASCASATERTTESPSRWPSPVRPVPRR